MRSERLREGGDSARLPSLVIAGIAQLVEHNLAKVGVAGSSPVSRFSAQRQHALLRSLGMNVRDRQKVAGGLR